MRREGRYNASRTLRHCCAGRYHRVPKDLQHTSCDGSDNVVPDGFGRVGHNRHCNGCVPNGSTHCFGNSYHHKARCGLCKPGRRRGAGGARSLKKIGGRRRGHGRQAWLGIIQDALGDLDDYLVHKDLKEDALKNMKELHFRENARCPASEIASAMRELEVAIDDIEVARQTEASQAPNASILDLSFESQYEERKVGGAQKYMRKLYRHASGRRPKSSKALRNVQCHEAVKEDRLHSHGGGRHKPGEKQTCKEDFE